MYNRFAVGVVAALALTTMPASAAVASARGTAHRAGQVAAPHAGITFRGGWRLAHVKLPRNDLPHARVTGGTATSGDWSGYADTGSSVAFRFVTANLNVPNVDCAASTLGKTGEALAYTWAGLDGLTSDTVEQAGFAEECTSGATQSYYAWYEMYPSPLVMVHGPKPGDAVVASVYFDASAGTYTLEVNDLTQKGAGFTVTERCTKTCSNSSAEVITEVPGGGVPAGYDLADFGAVGYTNAAVTSRNGTRGNLGANGLWSPTQITMTDPGQDTMATAGPLQGNTAFLESFVKSS